jgi:hypothetical protein
MARLDYLSVKGFLSIGEIDKLRIGSVNVLVGKRLSNPRLDSIIT